MSVAIKVEGLSKAYQLGQLGTGTITKDLERWWVTRIQRKEDPFLKIGEENDRTKKGNGNIVWALRDIGFEVKQGQALGIIGRNGAGKSTLLKILSRTTSPTAGSVKIKGRMASLLEVGTGFHPELTGRENTFLNGAILGMTKSEIRRKFDEIVDFAGIEKYIDTPVKRYSSGMYVRLAFAVAAHLEPEILVVDEVLAVGDAEFQRKCLGKMEDVSRHGGRTVLFVSHNMTAMNSLCSTVMYLKNGMIERIGDASAVINHYLSTGSEIRTSFKWSDGNAPGDEVAQLLGARLINRNHEHIHAVDFYEDSGIEFTYQIKQTGYLPVPNLHLYNEKGDFVFVTGANESDSRGEIGVYKTVMWIPRHLLNDGRYSAGLAVSTMLPERIHFYQREAIVFDVVENMNKRNTQYRGSIPGVVRPDLKWDVLKIN